MGKAVGGACGIRCITGETLEEGDGDIRVLRTSGIGRCSICIDRYVRVGWGGMVEELRSDTCYVGFDRVDLE